MMSELKYYRKEMLIMKIRLQGTLDEINTYVKDMERFYTIIHQSLPYKIIVSVHKVLNIVPIWKYKLKNNKSMSSSIYGLLFFIGGNY